MQHLTYSQSDIEVLRRSVGEFGFGALGDPVPPDTFAKLKREVADRANSAVIARRGGAVNYQARIASLGAEGEAFLFGREMKTFLSAVFNERVAPSEDRCCLTVYREGDHLGPHRDEPANECWITAILYVDVRSTTDSEKTGLVLQVFGTDFEEEKSPRLTIPSVTGTLAVGLGARFWHERPVLARGEYVAAFTACYRRE